MSYIEPNPDFERELTSIQHACGAIMLIFNGAIVLLIVFDNDRQNKQYRKYMCCLQISSLAYDTFSDFYAPIFLMHKGLVYSDSILANAFGIGKFIVLMVFFAEVVLSYFECVYYRRCIVIGANSWFTYSGWRRVALFLSLQMYGLCAVSGEIYFLRKSAEAAEKSLPFELEWVKTRTTYLSVFPDENMRMANYVSAPAATVFGLAIIAMLAQLVREVRTGVRKTSNATRRYQTLVVRSLILQGAVPSLVYLIPGYANSCIQYAPVTFDLGERFDRFATVVSPVLWVFITKHTFVSSLTILYCSPSYRQRIFLLITRKKAICPTIISETTKKSELTL